MDNVSANPGCECFLIFDSGFDSNVSIGEMPEIELPIYDLMHVIMNIEADNSI